MTEYRRADTLEPYVPQTRAERNRVIYETLKAHPEGLNLGAFIAKLRIRIQGVRVYARE